MSDSCVKQESLNAFINHVQGLIGDGVLSAAEGQALIDDANNNKSRTPLFSQRPLIDE